MYKAIVTSVVCITSLSPAISQEYHGGLGNFFYGPVYNSSSSLEKGLGSNELLGNNLKLNVAAFSYGGAGYSIRRKGAVLGGSGYFYNIGTTSYNGKTELSVSQGFFNVGYCVLNKKTCIGFPYFGFGAFGSNFRITNTTSDKVMILGNDSISSQKKARYSAGGFAFEMGFALKYFVFTTPLRSRDKKMKVSIGVDAGASFLPSFERWQNVVTDEKIISMPAPFIMSIYTRATVGLGVFNYKKG